MVWHAVGERYKPQNTVSYFKAGGGSVHVWGVIWKGGRRSISILRNVVTQSTCINLLRRFFQDHDLPSNSVFQDDNAPAPRAAAVLRFKEESNIRSLPWPSRSPDLNPIEERLG